MRKLLLQVLPASQPPMATTSVFPVQFALTLNRTLWSHALSTQLFGTYQRLSNKVFNLYIFENINIRTKLSVLYHLKQFNRSTYALKLLRVFWRLFHVQVSKSFKYKYKQHKKQLILNFCYFLLFCVFCAVLSVWVFCTGHFDMVPLNLTFVYWLQHFILFEHLFILYGFKCKKINLQKKTVLP